MAQANNIQNKIDFFKKRLYDNRIDKKVLLAKLKKDHTFSEIKKILNALGVNQFVNKYFDGIPFPKLKELGNIFYVYATEDLEKELSIQCLSFTKYADKINSFIVQKNKYENSLLLGDYHTAASLLEEIENSFGYSLWLIENKFVVAEAIGGVKSNKEYLNLINKTTDNTLVTTFAHYLSIRAERRVSPFSFLSKLESFQDGLDNSLQEYFAFKLNFLMDINEISNLCDIITYENTFSVLDRYLTFIKMCQIVVTAKAGTNQAKSIINPILILSNKINDSLFRNYLLRFGGIQELNTISYDSVMLDLYEDYTNGRYATALEISENLLRKYPTEFTLLEVYVKANIFLKKKPEPINGDLESFLNQAIEQVYRSYCGKDSDNESFTSIIRIAYSVQSMSWSLQLYNFLLQNFIEESDLNFEKIKLLNCQNLNPLFYKTFDTEEDARDFLIKLSRKKELNVLALFLAINSCTAIYDLDSLRISQIPEYRIKSYKAKSYKKIGDLQKAIENYEELIENNEIGIVLFEESFSNLLDCYYYSNEFNKFVRAYVEKYLENPNLLRRVNIRDIHKKIESSKFKDVDQSIFLPIFYRITDREPHLINLSIRHYFKAHGYKRPVEIVAQKEYLKQEYIIYFLSQVCTIEIIKFFRYFAGTKDVLNERLEICQLLLTIDRKNQNTYDQEIGKIAQNLVIFEGIKQVDESKIFIDEKGIRGNELKENRNHFARYIEISELVKSLSIVVIDILNNKKMLLHIGESRELQEEMGKAKISENVKFEFFRELFLEIRDKYLFSTKFGLDAYLSTRIRHGTLLGQIRSPFQEEYLITQRDKENEEYSDNEYWNKKLDYLEESKREALQLYLAEFSQAVDGLANELKNELIQIKTNSKITNGLFDYTYPKNTLLPLFEAIFFEITNYDLFLDAIFNELKNTTDINLEIIRNYISTTFKNHFLNKLHELESKLKSLRIEFKEFQELLTNIINCKTNISYELDRIADWFQIRETVVKDFLIDKVIDTCVEITNKISQRTKIQHIKRDIQSAAMIKGEFFIGIFDLLRIFLENIVKYSLLETNNLIVDISAFEQGQWMTVIIKNNLSEEVDLVELRSKFEQKRKDLDSPSWDSTKISKEEGTGFYKAKKILTTDLQDEKNYFTFIINDDNEVVIKLIICLTAIQI